MIIAKYFWVDYSGIKQERCVKHNKNKEQIQYTRKFVCNGIERYFKLDSVLVDGENIYEHNVDNGINCLWYNKHYGKYFDIKKYLAIQNEYLIALLGGLNPRIYNNKVVCCSQEQYNKIDALKENLQKQIQQGKINPRIEDSEIECF